MIKHFITHIDLHFSYMTFVYSKPHNYFCTYPNEVIQVAYKTRLTNKEF